MEEEEKKAVVICGGCGCPKAAAKATDKATDEEDWDCKNHASPAIRASLLKWEKMERGE